MNAVDAKSGKLIWQSGSLGQGFGTSGQFYSTPAVAFGRVYAGNDEDRVYSYDINDGTLAWSYSTGGYAYSGPTVATTATAPPTVYIGSFDGNVYALDAKDGHVRWSRSAGGQVVGSLSAVGDIVYVAEFTNNTTSGFMMKSGRKCLPLRPRYLLAGDLRRPPPLPDRLLEHHRPAALQVQARRRSRDRRAEAAGKYYARRGPETSTREAWIFALALADCASPFQAGMSASQS